MDDVPLPKVDYDAGWHRQYTADQMHAHAAAVSAAKDAEIAQLRADLIKSLADNKALRECAIDLWMMLDDIDTGGDRAKADDVLYRAIAERTHRRRFSPKYQIVIDAIDAARKGTTPTTPPPSPSPRS